MALACDLSLEGAARFLGASVGVWGDVTGVDFPSALTAFELAAPGQWTVLPSGASALSIQDCRATAVVGNAVQEAEWRKGRERRDAHGWFLRVPTSEDALWALLEGPCRPGDDPDDWLSEAEVVESFGPGARTAMVHRSARIGADVRLGAGTVIHPRVAIGDGCRIGDGCSLGSNGFGLKWREGRWAQLPHWAGVVLGARVHLGPGCQVSAGLLEPTSIGEGAHLDAQIQVGHNCRVGRDCVIAGQTGLAGSVVLGAGCRVGGQVGFADHVRVGDRCEVAARSGVTRSWPSDARLAGFPARPIGEWRRSQVHSKT